jgi:hypothetical protein
MCQTLFNQVFKVNITNDRRNLSSASWNDALRRTPQTLCCVSAKVHGLILIKRKTRHTQIVGDSSKQMTCVFPKILVIWKTKKGWRFIPDWGELRTWQLNAMHEPWLDEGEEMPIKDIVGKLCRIWVWTKYDIIVSCQWYKFWIRSLYCGCLRECSCSLENLTEVFQNKK